MYNFLPNNMEISLETKENIIAVTNAKIKKEKLKNLKTTCLKTAASIAIVLVALFAIGFENVVSAAERLFYFIPGFGIEEQTNEPVLILKKTVDVENDLAKTTLFHAQTAYGENTGIKLNFKVDYKFAPVNHEEYENIYNNLKISLIIKGVEYSNRLDFHMSSGFEGIVAENYTIEVPKEYIKSGRKIILSIESPDFGNAKIPFKLVDVNKSSYADIQTTKVGEVEVTAIKYESKLDGEKYTVVDVIPFGPSNMEFEIFPEDRDAVYFLNEDKSIVRPKETIGSAYYFNTEDIKENAVFKVKNILCIENLSGKYYKVDLPDNNTTKELNVTVPFSFGEFKFVSVENTGNELIFEDTVESDYKVDGVCAIFDIDEKDVSRLMLDKDSLGPKANNYILKFIGQPKGSLGLSVRLVDYFLNEQFIFNFN